MRLLASFAVAVLAALWLGVAPAAAQNMTCPTMPAGDASNACASTAFVGNPASINFAGNQVMTGSWPGNSAPSNSKIYWLGSLTGVCNNGGNTCGGGIEILANVAVTQFGGVGNIPVLIEGIAYLQPAHNGGFTAANFQLNLFHTTSAIANNTYTAMNSAFIASENDNGTGGTPQGNAQGHANFCYLNPGATFFYECSGHENDIAIAAGASAAYQYGAKTVLAPTHATAASSDGAAFGMGAYDAATSTLA